LANKYAVGSGNWNSATLWKTSSGGSTATTQPTSSDTAYLDANSGAVAINATTCGANSIICTGYTNTLTFTAGQTLTIANGAITFVSTMTIAGSGKLKVGTSPAVTYTSGGIAISGDFECSGGSGAKTLSGAWIINGLFISTGTEKTVFNGSTLRLNGGITLGQSVDGTTVATIAGGTLSSTNESAGWGLTTSYAGTITIGNFGFQKGTHTYSSGTVTVTAGTTQYLVGGNDSTAIFNFGTNIRFQNCKVTGNRSNARATGTLYIDGNYDFAGDGYHSIASGTIAIAGSIINSAGLVASLFGAGTWLLSGTGSVCGITLATNMTINTTGTITFLSTGFIRHSYLTSTRIFTYTAGTVVVETGHKLISGATSVYINSGSINWDEVYFGVSDTNTIIYLTGNFVCNKLNVSPFAYFYLPASLTPYERGYSVSLRIYNTYTLTVKTSMNCFRGKAGCGIRSNSGTAYLDYQGNIANMDISNVDFANIVSTNRLYSYYGTASVWSNVFVFKEYDVLDAGMSMTFI